MIVFYVVLDVFGDWDVDCVVGDDIVDVVICF